MLIHGFNRPDRLHDLIDSLRNTAPRTVYVAVDGARANHPGEGDLVRRCQQVISEIDWTTDVRTQFHQHNIGLQRACPEAISWVLEEFESVIVLEDDVVVGPQFMDFASRALSRFRERSDIFAVSGYNLVPNAHLSNPDAATRLSRIPETYAWGTWRRAWNHYDPELTWARGCSLGELATIVGSAAAAARWKQNFSLARHSRISTFSYRWAASMWSQNGYCLSPNKNLVTYHGYTSGTNTRRRARWKELPIEPLDLGLIDVEPQFDPLADRYINRQVFRATSIGLGLGPAEAVALEILARRRRRRIGHTALTTANSTNPTQAEQ